MMEIDEANVSVCPMYVCGRVGGVCCLWKGKGSCCGARAFVRARARVCVRARACVCACGRERVCASFRRCLELLEGETARARRSLPQPPPVAAAGH